MLEFFKVTTRYIQSVKGFKFVVTEMSLAIVLRVDNRRFIFDVLIELLE